jgi:hypothetical protein
VHSTDPTSRHFRSDNFSARPFLIVWFKCGLNHTIQNRFLDLSSAFWSACLTIHSSLATPPVSIQCPFLFGQCKSGHFRQQLPSIRPHTCTDDHGSYRSINQYYSHAKILTEIYKVLFSWCLRVKISIERTINGYLAITFTRHFLRRVLYSYYSVLKIHIFWLIT